MSGTKKYKKKILKSGHNRCVCVFIIVMISLFRRGKMTTVQEKILKQGLNYLTSLRCMYKRSIRKLI